MNSFNLKGWPLRALTVMLTMTAITYAVALALGWVKFGELNGFELFAGALNYGATYLCIKQKRAYAIVGIVGSIAWAYVFWNADLLASATVNLYLAGMLVYGFWRWGKDDAARPVRQLKLRWLPVYIATTAAIYFGAVWITTALGGAFAFWDAAILVLTILAQLLQDQKVILGWFVWGAVNIVGVILYWNAGLYFAVLQQAIFGVANIWGYKAWKKTMAATKTEETTAARELAAI